MSPDSAFEYSFHRIGLRVTQLLQHAAIQGRFDTEGQRLALLADLGEFVAALMADLCAEICKQTDMRRADTEDTKTACLDAWRENAGYLIRQSAIAASMDDDDAEAALDHAHVREESRADLYV